MTARNKTEIAEEAYKLAFDYELEFGCCPQCVLTTVKETVGFVTDDVIKASHGLSGGGGLAGVGTCGALTGGLMALSSKRGRDRENFPKGKYIVNFKHGEKLVEKFKQEFGGVTCQELQQNFTGRTYDLWNADEYSQFDKERETKCAHASAMVAKWVVEAI